MDAAADWKGVHRLVGREIILPVDTFRAFGCVFAAVGYEI